MEVQRRRVLGPALLCLLLAACSSGPGGSGAARSSSATTTGTTTSASAPPSTARTTPSTTPATTSSSPADRGPADPESLVTAAVDRLDARARVAQLFLVGVPLDDLDAGPAVVRSGVGGVFLAGRSALSTAELAATTAAWQSDAPGPALWVAVDQEGGAVQGLKGPGFARLPSALAQGALPAGELAGLAGDLGHALHDAGVNLDLAPVADIVPAGTEKQNAPIGFYDRQYGSTARTVVAAAGTVVDGLADAGVTATLKHFPGLGRVQGNTDSAAAVTDTVTTTDDDQVAAFGSLARSPARPFVMISSATYRRIDPANQAMFSSAVLTDLLRNRLGFDGVILTDDVGNAAAVQHVPPGQRAVWFLNAGGTMVLTVDSDDVPAMIDAVVAATRHDPGFARVVDAAVRTALLAKARAGLLPAA